MLKDEVVYSMGENIDTEKDKFSESDSLRLSVSVFSAVLVLAGVVSLTFGNAPIVPYTLTEISSVEKSDLLIPLSLPVVGDVPMLTFLPNYGVFEEIVDSESVRPENSLPVISLTMTPHSSMSTFNGAYLNNEAKKDLNPILKSDYSELTLKTDGSVQVIIYHTHGTESYNNDGLSYYGDEFYAVHSSDMSENVVHVGQVITEKLRQYGIGVVHDTTMYDADGYGDAYDRSCDGVEKLLALYPDAKLVLDIHRDTIVLSDGSKYRPIANWKNRSAAQMMILVGTGKKTAPNDHWETNLTYATELYRAAEDICGNIMRPILLRNSGYNQHLSTGSLLVEMGTCGNSLEEAEAAAEILGEAIIAAFCEN